MFPEEGGVTGGGIGSGGCIFFLCCVDGTCRVTFGTIVFRTTRARRGEPRHRLRPRLGIRLDWLGAVIVSSTALACIWRADSMAPGLAGLSLTYALSFVGFASFTIRAVADTEMQMNSVERIAHYTTLEARERCSSAGRHCQIAKDAHTLRPNQKQSVQHLHSEIKI